MEITYFLPVTRARLRCSVSTLTDSVFNDVSRVTSGWTVELITVADRTCARVLAVESGAWRDYAFKLGLTEDGRLTQAGVESTGQVGKALMGAATAVAGMAALVTGHVPLALGIAASTAARKAPSGIAPAGLDTTSVAGPTPAERVASAYAQAHPGESKRLAALTGELKTTQDAVDRTRGAYLAAATDETRVSARQAYRAARSVLRDVEAELDKAKAHFEAWRKSTMTESIAVHDLLVPLVALPTYGEQGLTFAGGDEGAAVQRLFAEAGQILAVPAAVRHLPVPVAVQPEEAARQAATSSVQVRRPRMLELVTVYGDNPDSVTVTAVHRELVMDQSCEEFQLPVRKSWNAKRRLDVQLSELGALTGVDLNGGSSMAAASDAFSGAAGSLAGSLESAVRGRTAVETLASAQEESELAQLKRQVAITEHRLLASAQATTAADYAKLAQLKQAVEVAELKAKMSAGSATLAP